MNPLHVRVVLLSSVALALAGCPSNQTRSQPPSTGLFNLPAESSGRAAALVGSNDAAGSRSAPSPVPSVDADPRTRRNDDGAEKIIGGYPVEGGNFSDTVGIAGVDRRVSCTGTLIEPDVVLTAAHCVCYGISNVVYVGNVPNQWKTSVDVVQAVEGLQSNCNTDAASLKTRRDLGLLLLRKPISGVQPRAVANDALVDRATSFRAVGFGAIDRNGIIPAPEKREARILATSNDCRGTVRNLDNRSDESVYGCQPGEEIVAGSRLGRTDTCNGDSGGPFLVSPQGTGMAANKLDFRLAGVTSRLSGISRTACGDGGIYERLDAGARDWIAREVKKLREAEGKKRNG